ncbi:hypothetical protein QTP86_001512 [Hemibagrus guttatus]|nr:hypothetical protein QTP86_001512 [Hemibagrus guttatus]
MLTTKLIASQIRFEDWFVTIDLKDAYFHTGIQPEHRKFLRFAFGGDVYQFRGIRVLNYLDDWLILAHSKAMAASHWSVVLAHIRSLGLRINPEKCVLSPSQRTTFLRVICDSTMMQACLSPAWVASIPLGLLHMRLFQFWLRGAGFHPRRHQTWLRLHLYLHLLDGLLEATFEPMQSEKFLTLKTALLLALDSLRRLGDLQALSVAPTCLEFAPGMSKAILHPRAGYAPKVLRMARRPVILQAFCLLPYESAEQERLHLLCPVRALKNYVQRSGSWRKSPFLFVCFGSWNKGNPVSKQRLAHWAVEVFTQAYEARDIASPLGVRAHSTRGVASSSALARGVPLQEICAAANWSSPHTFIRFYNLDTTGLGSFRANRCSVPGPLMLSQTSTIVWRRGY